jgi:hypothetical protein
VVALIILDSDFFNTENQVVLQAYRLVAALRVVIGIETITAEHIAHGHVLLEDLDRVLPVSLELQFGHTLTVDFTSKFQKFLIKISIL